MSNDDADLGRNLTVTGRTLTHAEFDQRTELVPEKMEWDGGIFTSDRAGDAGLFVSGRFVARHGWQPLTPVSTK